MRTLEQLWLPLAALAAGCSNVAPIPFESDPRVTELRAAGGPPVELRVSVALPSVPAVPETTPEDAASHPVSLDARDLQGEVVGLLKGEKLFAGVTASPARDRGAALAEAWERRDDLVLELTVGKADASYKGVNGWFYPNLFLWWYALVPSWWVADETYECQLEATARLLSVHSGREVFRREFRIPVERDLDDFDRGWGLFVTLKPGSLDADGWKRVGGLLWPHALHRLKVDLFSSFRLDLPKETEAEPFREALAKTLVLAVGVTQHADYALHNVRCAEPDARAVAEALRKGGDLPEKNVRVLTNAQATGAAIRAEVKDFLAGRARDGDTVVLYVAGYGVVLPGGKPALVPYDFAPSKAESTAIPLEEIGRALPALRSGRALVVLDMGWAAPGEGRGLADVKGLPEAAALPEGAFGALAGSRRLLLLGAGPGEGAYEIAETGHGLLTHALLEGLSGRADGNEDGQVTADEAAGYAVVQGTRQAGLEGRSQTPRLAGGAPGGVLARAGR